MDVRKPLKELMNGQSLTERIEAIQDEAARPAPSATVEESGQVADNTGTQIVGLLVAPAPGVDVLDPTDVGFTGVFISGEGLTFGGVIYNWGIVNAGVLQVGGNDVAKFLAGAGAVTMDADGIKIIIPSSPTDQNSYKFTDASGTTVYSQLLACLLGGGTSHTIRLLAAPIGILDTGVTVQSSAPAGKESSVYIITDVASGEDARISLETGTNNRIIINASGGNVDTIIKGDTTDVVTVDAALEKAIITNLDVTGTLTSVHGISGNQIKPQGDPTDASTAAITVAISRMLTGIIVGTPGVARAYTLDTGSNCDAGMTIAVNEAFEWTVINLSTNAANIITITAAVGHAIVGNPLVAAQAATTGGLWGTSSATFRTRKTAANTFITYRIA